MAQSFDVADVLVVEEIVGTYADPRGRKTRQVFATCCSRVGINVVNARLAVKVSAPSERVVFWCPPPRSSPAPLDRSIVEHRIGENLARDVEQSIIDAPQRECRG